MKTVPQTWLVTSLVSTPLIRSLHAKNFRCLAKIWNDPDSTSRQSGVKSQCNVIEFGVSLTWVAFDIEQPSTLNRYGTNKNKINNKFKFSNNIFLKWWWWQMFQWRIILKLKSFFWLSDKLTVRFYLDIFFDEICLKKVFRNPSIFFIGWTLAAVSTLDEIETFSNDNSIPS